MSADARIEEMILEFIGPFKFSDGEQYLFNSEVVNSSGLYIWTIKNEVTGHHYVHYVGETMHFGKRHREHFMNIVGLNYRIVDPLKAKMGIQSVIWNGMWRDKSKKAVANVIENQSSVSHFVLDYIDLLNIFLAPVDADSALRRHIEGCIGLNLRHNHVEHKVFYPDDNHVGRQTKEYGLQLRVVATENILGLDNVYHI